MRPLITSALIAASLALAGNGAMAANVHAKPNTKAAPAHAASRVATRYRYPDRYPAGPFAFGRPPANAAQIISSLLASPLVAPYVAQYAGKIRTTRGSSGGTYEPYDPPTNDTSSPPDTSVQDSLNAQAEQQAIDSINESNEMNATIAADAAQAAADDQAMTQQIMNNGGL
jgi:hypothetical protein